MATLDGCVMLQFWVLLLCGLAGAALKSWIAQSQGTLSRRSIGDAVVGAVVGGLFPLLVPYLPTILSGLWEKADSPQQALLVFGMSFFSSAVLLSVLQKVGLMQNVLSPQSFTPPARQAPGGKP